MNVNAHERLALAGDPNWLQQLHGQAFILELLWGVSQRRLISIISSLWYLFFHESFLIGKKSQEKEEWQQTAR